MQHQYTYTMSSRGRPVRRGGKGDSGAPGQSQKGKLFKSSVSTTKNAPEIMAWLTQPSHSASASSLSPVATTSNVVGQQESEELFSHTFIDFSDAQPFVPSDAEENPSISVTQRSDTSNPAVASYAEISTASGGGADVDDMSVDLTWVPTPEDEEGSSEGESSQGRAGTPQTARDTVTNPPRTVISHPPKQGSAVWTFFNVSAADSSIAICTVCSRRVSRGKPGTRLGTTALKRHMVSHHRSQWEQRAENTQRRTPGDPRPAPSTSPLSSHSSSTAASTAPSSQTFRKRQSSSSSSVAQLFERQKMMTPDNPLAQRLTAGLSELLARQLLPYNLVESEAFQKFVAIGTPQWKVPGRKHFSQKGIPDLYAQILTKVKRSLAASVGSKIHLTTDTWSSQHGQGRYMTITAHWVNLLTPDTQVTRGTRKEILCPPRIVCRPASCSPPTPPSTESSFSSAESAFSCGSASSSTPAVRPRNYSTAQVRRCHAVLRMLCLEASSHTGSALLAALRAQVDEWLTPQNLQIGNVVCDNGANLLSALKQGKIPHVPCMAHVLNLIVQRFIVKYPGLQDVLQQARKISAHFRRSYTAMARLAEIQRRHKLPVRRLICDCPTRWNSSLHMLDRLLQQQRAVNDYMYQQCSRTVSGELGFLSPRQWVLMRHACRLLRPFEEVTKMVSRSESTISDIVPYAFFLERALRRVIDEAVDQRDYEEEELAMLDQLPGGDSATQTTQQESEEDSDEDGGWGQEDIQESALSGAVNISGAPGVVRGWGEETEEEEDIFFGEEQDPGHSEANDVVQMGSFLLKCLKLDPRIKNIRLKDLYWLATYLDPRYKHKIAEMIPPAQRSARMQQLQALLRQKLHSSVADTAVPTATLREPVAAPATSSTPAATRGRFRDVLVSMDMRSFFTPRHLQASTGATLRGHLDRQVSDYITLTADVDIVRSDEPLDYWVSRLDLWPDLSTYAIQLLACPSSSVLSERTFSAAGGIVTDKRTRLGHESVDYLTFIKMNEGWII